MASLDLTTMDAALKQLYAVKRVQDLTYKHNPLFALIPKFEDFGGRNLPLVNTVTHPQGISAAFATAQTNATAAVLQDFLLTRVRKYGVATVDGETAQASKKDSYAFLDAMSVQIDGQMKALARAIAIDIPRSGGGSIGRLNAVDPSGGLTGTLLDINEIVNFEVGMVLKADTVDGGGTVHTGSLTVAAVNRSTGVITTTANWDTGISSIGASDFLFREGDYDGTVSGLEAWCPTTAPTATLFFGVDRSVDTRLGGQRFDGSATSIQEALVNGQSVGAREGGMMDYCFLNHRKMRDLINELGAKVEYDMARPIDAPQIGFRSVVLQGDHGPIKVVADNTIPNNVAWMLQLDTWKLCTLGPATQLLQLDGNRILRQSGADGYEVRLGMYGNVGCTAPGYNVRITLSA